MPEELEVKIPRRPWVLSKQYGMTYVLSQDNEIIIGNESCCRIGDKLLKHLIEAANSYADHPKEQNEQSST